MKDFILIKKKRLFFRDDARKLIQLICQKAKKNNSKAIYLDFSGVDFFSRSFIDEFLNGINKIERAGVKVRFLNLRPVLQEFIARVKKMKSKIRKTLLQSQ